MQGFHPAEASDQRLTEAMTASAPWLCWSLSAVSEMLLALRPVGLGISSTKQENKYCGADLITCCSTWEKKRFLFSLKNQKLTVCIRHSAGGGLYKGIQSLSCWFGLAWRERSATRAGRILRITSVASLFDSHLVAFPPCEMHGWVSSFSQNKSKYVYFKNTATCTLIWGSSESLSISLRLLVRSGEAW